MNWTQRELTGVWEALRGQRTTRQESLEEVRIVGFRGIADLRVLLPYPVTVLAGPNGCGKSTVLSALAAAYQLPGDAQPCYTPFRLFPDFRPRRTGAVRDAPADATLEYAYVTGGQRLEMRWTHGRSRWKRSFLGRRGGRQPARPVYLRTLANLTSPAEVRSILQLASRDFQETQLDAETTLFAQHVLSFQYDKIVRVSHAQRDLLFAVRRGAAVAPVAYSEFHMAAGERAVLRLAMALCELRDALVLVDEIEAGLHPAVQQMLMLELQRLALRNQLQIVVATHSETVLDSVPREGRIFLRRREDELVVVEPYHDIIQRVLYGRAVNTLYFLCEDEAAEAILRGVLDVIGPQMSLPQDGFVVGHNSSKNDFPHHVRTLAQLQKLYDTVFVMDGDARDLGPRLAAEAAEAGQPLRLLFLPGAGGPEGWAWELLRHDADTCAAGFHQTPAAFREDWQVVDDLFANAVDKPANIAKAKVLAFARKHARTVPEVLRLIAATEAARHGELQDLVTGLMNLLHRWRADGLGGTTTTTPG